LLHVSEKLTAELEIAQYRIQGLEKTIIHKKKKRKRGKAMNLYDPGEKEGEALFFSPARIGRVRARNADDKQAEEQRKQIVSDKKRQRAIARDEKAREAEEKRIARDFARQTAREELAREKAERQAIRQTKKAQKETEATKRKQDAAKVKAQRIQVKEAANKSVKGKKRSLNVDVSERVKKRPRLQTSRSHFATNLKDSKGLGDTTGEQLLDTTLSVLDTPPSLNHMRNARSGRISLPLRSGRSSRLPARFR
jgi:hypothetical protein